MTLYIVEIDSGRLKQTRPLTKMMRNDLLLLLLAASLATAAKFSNDPLDGESFYAIPRTRAEAEAGTGDNVWVLVEDGTDPYVVFCQPENERFCPLYDRNGIVAGMQIGIPFEDIADNSHIYPYETNVLYRKMVRFGRDTWVGTAFFVNIAVLEAGGRSDLSQGTLEQLWLQYGPSYTDARQIPLDPATLLSTTAFQLENCVPTMGIHYYYNITEALPCEQFDPWFMLYEEQQITGIGFQSFGRSVVRPNMRHYDEEVPLPAVLHKFVSF
ncbi:hypothetical protein B566_EDAN001267 [Ephemera danica]|nr:hypothetical protein B566_EDAN001267 [Ephemera danica]